MTNLQNEEFKTRVMQNIVRVMEKGLSFENAQKVVFEKLNKDHPLALASFLNKNAA